MPSAPRLSVAAALLVVGAVAVTPRAWVSAPEALTQPWGSGDSGESVATVRLLDSAAAAQLAERTAGTLLVEPHMGTAQVADRVLDVDISTGTDTTVKSYRAGDVAYWAGGAKVVIFLTDGAAVPPQGLIPLGQVSDGMDHLSDCTSDCVVHLDAAALSPGRAGG